MDLGEQVGWALEWAERFQARWDSYKAHQATQVDPDRLA